MIADNGWPISWIGSVISVQWRLLVSTASWALALICPAEGRAQTSKPPVEVDLCDTGMDRVPVKESERRCPDGHKVRRTLLIPGNVNMTPHQKGADGRTYETWGIFLSILLTDHGLMFQPQPSNLKRSDIHADSVSLHAGWAGLFESDLNRAVGALARSAWGDDPRRRVTYAWNDDGDPDFKVFEARENTTETGLAPLLLPKLLVPKSGAPIFFQCAGPALYRGQSTDPLCAVRDFTDPAGDALRYSLRYTRLRDWRRYST